MHVTSLVLLTLAVCYTAFEHRADIPEWDEEHVEESINKLFSAMDDALDKVRYHTHGKVRQIATGKPAAKKFYFRQRFGSLPPIG